MHAGPTPRCVVIGTTTVDLTLTGFERLPSSDIDEFTEAGIALTEDPARMTLGGNGANSAFVLAGLGAEVVLCSVIGTDPLGDTVVRWLTERGVGLGGVTRQDGTATSLTVIAMDRRMQRIALHHAGGSHSFGPDSVPAAAFEGAELVLLTGYHLLPRFRAETAADLLAPLRRGGAITAVDLGPAVPPIAALDELSRLLPEVSYLIANEHELRQCSGASELDDAARRFFEAGAHALVIKRGAAGASLITETERFDQPGFKLTTSSTVGAGDSFNAGFLFALGRGATADAALRYANAVAAAVVRSPDGVMSSPPASAVEAALGDC